MIIFDLSVEKQQIFGADKISLAANANETISFRFHFDRYWRIFDSKAAIFKNSDGEYYIIEIKDCKVQVPWETLKKDGEIYLSVIGFENETVLTSKKVSIKVKESLLPDEYKTFLPSETLFDRFKRECTAKAFLDYEDEIQELKKSYEEKLLKMGSDLNSANKATADMEQKKNREIEQINQQHSAEIKSLNADIDSAYSELSVANEKAEKWEMIKTAISLKTSTGQQLWGDSSQLYALPELPTDNITAIYSTSFGNNLTEFGFNIANITSLEKLWMAKKNLKKVLLRNADNIQSMASSFQDATCLKEVSIKSLYKALSMSYSFTGCSSMEKVELTGVVQPTTMSHTFQGCYALKEIDVEFNCMLCVDFSYAFYMCANLEKLRFTENTIRKNLDLNSLAKLNKESILNVANGLSNEVPCTLKLSANAVNNAFPTEEEYEELVSLIVEEKGWAVSID